MRKITLLIFICSLYYNYTFSQKICGEVMYKEEAKITLFYQTISITKFNNNVAYTKFLHWKKAEKFLNGEYDSNLVEANQELVDSPNEDTGFVYSDKKETYFTDITWEETLVVKEDDFKWNWKLLGETKKIGKFNCQSASIRFRQRNYIAWFTTEIPVPFGPNKFKGLPGLILEIYDDEKSWYMKAINIKTQRAKNCNIDFDLKKIKSKALSVSKYLKLADSLHIDNVKKDASRLPKGSTILLPDSCERLYDGSMIEIFERQ